VTRLQSAIDRLGAVEVAPGRYALDDDETPKSWYVATAQGLLWLDSEQRFPDDDEQVGVVRIKPKWWSPERRYAHIDYNGIHRSRGTKEDAERVWMAGPGRIVTADLATGAEVPA
jgi:hypothetical protein